MKNKIVLLVMLTIAVPDLALAQQTGKVYTCMFYNVENLFHPANDSLLQADDDFTPEGSRRWTWYRYHQKIAGICKVILAANAWEPPDLICLCETENRSVLEDIAGHPLLMHYRYGIVHKDSPDHRGMDVAMLFRTDRVNILDSSWIELTDQSGASPGTRYILFAECSVASDTFLVIENHWVSKYGGSAETESLRIHQARTLGTLVDSILSERPGLLVVAGGDFNDGSKEKSIRTLCQEYSFRELLPPGEAKTYKYLGKWESIDHVFIRGRSSAWKTSVNVITLPALLEADEKYTGNMPRRTYRGYAYNGGISDHLPLLVEFERVGLPGD